MAKANQAMMDLFRYNAAILSQKRSVFNKSHSHATTMDSGWLVPLMWDRVLPGDEKKIKVSALARMATPLHPTMDEAHLDIWAFYCPDRLWWRHAKEFYGENLDASFNPDGEYVMPTVKPTRYYLQDKVHKAYDANGRVVYTNDNGVGGLLDYIGMPRGYNGGSKPLTAADADSSTHICAGVFRVYQKIWNEHFRNSSIQPALTLNDGDTVTLEEWQTIRQLRKVNKLPDPYTSLLREPQAGADVLLPLGDWAPVVTRGIPIGPDEYRKINGSATPMHFASGVDQLDSQKWADINEPHVISIGPSTPTFGEGGAIAMDNDSVNPSHVSSLIPVNLYANLSNATAATINNLRAAITVQQLLELDSIAGKYYHSVLKAHFGVLIPDATLQRTELLGASRVQVGMRQVLQQSASTGNQALGDAGAVSVTNVNNEWICNRAFTEPGFIMVLCAVRPLHSYSQGVNPLLRKVNRYDHYWPVFDNLGNQPVYTSELFACTDGDDDIAARFKTVFGYRPAWDEYRYMPNRVSGLFRPDIGLGSDGQPGGNPEAYDVAGNLSSWNYSTYFKHAPILNSAFIEEDPLLIDRTIAVTSEPQFLLDAYFDYTDIKNMSVHSVPGLTRL